MGHIRDRSLPRKLMKTRGRVGYPSKISLLNDLTGTWAGKFRVCAGILISIVKEQALPCCYQTANNLHHYVSRLTAPGQGNNDQWAGLKDAARTRDKIFRLGDAPVRCRPFLLTQEGDSQFETQKML